MLKRLELVGFKSFADKTRFDFAPGITGVVGPNGSGKSNVVDAVRWILGEQSAKSLRGGEMADVIFNGSSNRKSLGLAEVTVTFDNSRRLLSVDADEVQLTRRVYRDGTGEYLINGQAARLKDFKEIFLGSGAGAGGYTIIAQGRVDELLQASTRDRREIFDEAAGISRFKAKKKETLAKLALVEANLTRSKDRLDSLESQLRTLRMQAAKAQKFQEYSDQLKGLRVGLGLREYRAFTESLEVEERALAELRSEVSGANERTEALDGQLGELDRELTRTEDGLRHQEGRLGEARRLITSFESTLKHERTAIGDHETEVLRVSRQRGELSYRVRSLEVEAVHANAEATDTESRLREEQAAATKAESALSSAVELVNRLDAERAGDLERQMQLVREAAAAQSLAGSTLSQVERLQKEYTRKRAEIEQNNARRTTLAAALAGLSQADADVQQRLATARERLTNLRLERAELNDATSRVQNSLEGLRVRQGDLRGRIGVLEDLDRAHDGLGAGVRVVLERLAADNGNEEPSPLRAAVAGLVADLLTVPHDIAPLVELALGDAAQRFVVRTTDAIDVVVSVIGEVPGRVGFIPYVSDANPVASASLASVVTSTLHGLSHQLLGNVYLTDSLADARRFSAAYPGNRFVTRTGELLEADGTLSIGPPKAAAGVVSRKSELRELREEFRRLAEQVAAAEVEFAELKQRMDAIEGVIAAVESEIALLADEAGDLQQKIARQQQEVDQRDELLALLQQEAQDLEQEVRRGEAEWVAARLLAEEAERAAKDIQARIAELQETLRAAEVARAAAQETYTAAQVTLSRAIAERDRARERVAQIESELRKRKLDALDLAAAERNARGRLLECELAMLRASAGQAEAYREKEQRERLVAELSAKAHAQRAERQRVGAELQSLRTGRQSQQNAAHAKELTVHDLQSKREAVLNRIREDYGLDLAANGPEAAVAPEIAALNAHQVQQEVEDLKKKLARLGSVNMEALEELTRVETEYNTLRSQHDDLASARKSLQEVIDAINGDSRKLFTDTLAAVRSYFQELFRKLFGGGQADIVLEDESDVLESGIEITARPPGKELRSLSLLSGGEKTMTAVALLLAIFRNKPSPFCILDEVDAALDEANTQRLASVLREFLDRSQFIVITHKKRTMAVADRLWGVTMQESGISRLLPMRFEDWTGDEGPAEQAA